MGFCEPFDQSKSQACALGLARGFIFRAIKGIKDVTLLGKSDTPRI